MSNHHHNHNTQPVVEAAPVVDSDAVLLNELDAATTEIIADEAKIESLLNTSEEELAKKTPEELQQDVKTLESAMDNQNLKAVQHVQNVAEKMVENLKTSATTVISDIQQLTSAPTAEQLQQLANARLLLENIHEFEEQSSLILFVGKTINPQLEISLGLVQMEYDKVDHFARTNKLKFFEGLGVLLQKIHAIKPEGRKFMQNKIDFVYFFLKFVNANRKDIMQSKLIYAKLTTNILTVAFSTASDVSFINKVCDYRKSMK
jgi:hypothetical protein